MSDATNLVDWGTVDQPRNRSQIEYLRLKPSPTPYVVRLFHKPIPVFRYYVKGEDGKGRSAITANPDTCPVAIRHPEVKAKARYAIIVLDRNDASKAKVMEAPAGVFKDFRKFFEANGIDPGGNEGVDFVITVKGSGMETRYEVAPRMGSKPFTEDEKATIRAARENGYNLDEIFKPTPIDKIEQVLFGGGTGGGTAETKKPQETAIVPEGGSAKKKDEFEWA
jgi:hypothetical protein